MHLKSIDPSTGQEIAREQYLVFEDNPGSMSQRNSLKMASNSKKLNELAYTEEIKRKKSIDSKSFNAEPKRMVSQ